MMNQQEVKLSGTFFRLTARGSLNKQDVMNELVPLGLEKRCPPTLNTQEAFKAACEELRESIVSRMKANGVLNKSYLDISVQKHSDYETNGFEFLSIGRHSSKNDYQALASVHLDPSTQLPDIKNDPSKLINLIKLKDFYQEKLNTIPGKNVGNKLRDIGTLVSNLGCAVYLEGSMWWFSDNPPNPDQDPDGVYDSWFKVATALSNAAGISGSTVRIRPLKVHADEESFGMVTDAIQSTISTKVEQLKLLFSNEHNLSDDEKMSEVQLKNKADAITAITKQLNELDKRLNLGVTKSALETALAEASRDCAALRSQVSARSVSKSNVMIPSWVALAAKSNGANN